MKKILIVFEGIDREQSPAAESINEFVREKEEQGFEIVKIKDRESVIRSLLEGTEPSSRNINAKHASIMFDINRYEIVIYVPAAATSRKDMPVYEPSGLDKNMIFYHIGNMNIVDEAEPQPIAGSDASAPALGGEMNEEGIQRFESLGSASGGEISEMQIAETQIKENGSETAQQTSAESNEALREERALTLPGAALDEASQSPPELKKPEKMPFSRKLALVFPWIVLGCMGMLEYSHVAWLPFILGVLGLMKTAISKKTRKKDKTAEWIGVLLLTVALGMDLYNSSWMSTIAVPISIMGILLFIIVGRISWED